jgi:hypothetical protein
VLLISGFARDVIGAACAVETPPSAIIPNANVAAIAVVRSMRFLLNNDPAI